MDCYGPPLPPGFKNEELQKEDTRLVTQVHPDQPSKSIVGPQCPTFISHKRCSNSDDEQPAKTSKLENEELGAIIGPVLPPELHKLINDENSSDSDKPYGPIPTSFKPDEPVNDIIATIEKRSKDMKNKLDQGEISVVESAQREEWMVVPDTSRKNQLGAISRCLAPGSQKKEFKHKKHHDHSERDKKTAEELKKYNKSKRAESLLELHNKDKKKKNKNSSGPAERKAFDREEMAVRCFNKDQKLYRSSMNKQSSYTKLQMGSKLMDSKSAKKNVKGKNISIKKKPVPEKKEITPPPMNPHEPDRSYSDYYCRICDSHMNSSNMWESHIRGKRHLKKINKDPSDTLPTKPKLKIKETAWIESQLCDIKDPIIGLKYVSEIRKSDPTLGATYKCFLCSASLATPGILIEHLYTTKHMLAYIKETDIEGHKLIEGLGLKKSALENVVNEHACKLEKKYGRGIVEVEMEKQQASNLKKWSYGKEKKGPPAKMMRTEYSDDDSNYSGHRDSRSYREPSPRNEGESRRFYVSYPNIRTYYERNVISPSSSPNNFYDRLPSLNENEHQENYLPQPYGPEEPGYHYQQDNSRYNDKQLTHNIRYDFENSPPRKMDGPVSDDLYFSHNPSVSKIPVQRLVDEEFDQRSYEPSIQREPPLIESYSRFGQRSYEPSFQREPPLIKSDSENLRNSRTEIFQPPSQLPSPHSPQFAASPPPYRRMNNEPVYATPDPPPEKTSFTISDFVKVIQMSPASLRLNLIEKLIPIELTSDEDCKRLEQIGNTILTSVMDYKVAFLEPEQQKRLKDLYGIKNDNLTFAGSPSHIPGINDNSKKEFDFWGSRGSARSSAVENRSTGSEQARAPHHANTPANFMELWDNATRFN